MAMMDRNEGMTALELHRGQIALEEAQAEARKADRLLKLTQVTFDDPLYWDSRYDKEGKNHLFDSYCRFEKIRPIIETFCGSPAGQHCLVVGCGNSRIPLDLFDFGYKHVLCTDLSTILVSHLQQLHKEKEGLDYIVSDARNMSALPDDGFDFVLDKGTFDSVICGPLGDNDVQIMAAEVLRVLKPEGVFFCVSHGAPDTRLHYFRQEALTWTAQAIPLLETESIYLYAMTKLTEEELSSRRRRVAMQLAADAALIENPHSMIRDKRRKWRPGNPIVEKDVEHQRQNKVSMEAFQIAEKKANRQMEIDWKRRDEEKNGNGNGNLLLELKEEDEEEEDEEEEGGNGGDGDGDGTAGGGGNEEMDILERTLRRRELEATMATFGDVEDGELGQDPDSFF